MDWNHIKENWLSIGAVCRTQWEKFTDEDVHDIDGRRDRLLRVLHRHYQYTPEEAERAVAAFEKSLKRPGQACE